MTEQCNPQEFAASRVRCDWNSDYGKSRMSEHPSGAGSVRGTVTDAVGTRRRWDFASDSAPPSSFRRDAPANRGSATSTRTTVMTPTDAALVAAKFVGPLLRCFGCAGFFTPLQKVLKQLLGLLVSSRLARR